MTPFQARSLTSSSPTNPPVSSRLQHLPRDLQNELVHFSSDFAWILSRTGLLPVPEEISQKSLSTLPIWSARMGFLSLLRWLHDDCQLPLTADICAAAAEGGHLDVL